MRWAAERWDDGGRTEGDLYRGGRLDTAIELAASEPLPGREAEFVEAGRRLRDREQSDVKRRTRRLRILAAATSVLAVVALVVGMLAIRAAGRADHQTTIAEARRVGAEALQERAYDRALLLAVEGVHLSDSAENATTCSTPSSAVPGDRGDSERRLTVAGRGELARRATRDRVRQPSCGDGLRPHHRDPVGNLGAAGITYGAFAVRPGGDVVAVSSYPTRCFHTIECPEAVVEVFDATDLSPRGIRYEGFELLASDMVYSTDGSLLATVGRLPVGRSAGQPRDLATGPTRSASVPSRSAERI